MRILIDGLQAGNRSGTGRYTIELARALARNVAQTFLSALVSPVPTDAQTGMSAPHCGSFSERKISNRDLSLTLAWPESLPFDEAGANVLRQPAIAWRRMLADQWLLPRLCRHEGIELIHYPANIGALFPSAVKSIVTIHDCSYCRHPEWFRAGRAVYYRLAMRQSAQAAARVIADSAATAQDLMEYAGLPGERIDVIPLGVDPCFAPASAEARAAIRHKLGLPEDFFLYVGTLEPRKNLERLIAAWSRHARQPGFPDLIIAGREGWKTEPVCRAAAKSPNADRIHFPGFAAQEDLPALLSAARAFVWPSLFEGFGLPPLEAMACGTPVLTSNTSSLPEVVGDAALQVDPYDIDALSTALEELASDDALCGGLSERGLARAAEFTWERTALLTLASYERAIQG